MRTAGGKHKVGTVWAQTGSVPKRLSGRSRRYPHRSWRAIMDVSGHWTELFPLPVGRTVRPKGLHKGVDAPLDWVPPPAPDAE